MSMGLQIDDRTAAVLDVLTDHRYATTGMLIEETGMTRPTLSKRLGRLRSAGVIEYVHEPTALWRLVKDPRAEVSDE